MQSNHARLNVLGVAAFSLFFFAKMACAASIGYFQFQMSSGDEQKNLLQSHVDSNSRDIRISVVLGEDDPQAFANLVGDATSRNLSTLLAVIPWGGSLFRTVSPRGCPAISTLNDDAFKAQLSDLMIKIKAAGGRVDLLEVGNEMNLTGYNLDIPETGILPDEALKESLGAYVRMVEMSREVVSATFPAAKVLSFGFSFGGGGFFGYPVDQFVRVARLPEIDLFNRVDGYALHDYIGPGFGSVEGTVANFSSFISAVPRKPVYVTEFGISQRENRQDAFRTALDQLGKLGNGIINGIYIYTLKSIPSSYPEVDFWKIFDLAPDPASLKLLRSAAVIQSGFVSVNGGIYFYNGAKTYCSIQSLEIWDWFNAMFGPQSLRSIATIPNNWMGGAPCLRAIPPPSAGYYRVAETGEFLYNNGLSHYCMDSLGTSKNRPGARTLPRALLMKPGQVHDGICRVPAGRYRLKSGGIFYNNGQGHYCGYASWGMYLASGGRADLANAPEVGAFSTGDTYVGSCSWPAGVYRNADNGGYIYNNGQGAWCWLQNWGNKYYPGFQAYSESDLRAGQIDGGVCAGFAK